MENKEPISVFRTSDLPLAAFLKYNSYIVQKIEKITKYKAEFHFKDVDRELLNAFNMDTTSVEPRLFASIMALLTKSARQKTNE